MLERVWRKGNPLTLLVGMQTSTATMENSVEIPEKIDLKLNIQKTKIMAFSPITSQQIDGETVETVADFILGAPKSLQMVTLSIWFKLCPISLLHKFSVNNKYVVYPNVHCSTVYNSQDMEAT